MEINQIRSLYNEAIEDTQKADFLHDYLSKQNLSEKALLLAYLGATWALKAKNAFLPNYKLFYIQEAQTCFAKAISLDAINIEIRFLRFSVEKNTPRFLGLSQHLETDKLLIINNLENSKIDTKMLWVIANFVLKSDLCKPEEILQLKSFLNQKPFLDN